MKIIYKLLPAAALRRWVLDALRMLNFIGQRLREEKLSQVASSLTFTTTLAIVPILTVALAIFTLMPGFVVFKDTVEAYFIKSLISPEIAQTIVRYLNQFALKASRLSPLGAALLIFAAVMMIDTIETAFNRIWRSQKKRPWTQRFLVYWTVITLGPVLIGVSASLTSHLFGGAKFEAGLSLSGIGFSLLSWMLVIAGFTLLYWILPNQKIYWRHALVGGIVAAILFDWIKRAFTLMIVQSSTYTVIYGALAAVPIFLIWIYCCWLITLLGAVFAAMLAETRNRRRTYIARKSNSFLDALALLRVLYEAYQGKYERKMTFAVLEQSTGIAIQATHALLNRMNDAGWVALLDTYDSHQETLSQWVLLKNLAHLRLYDVYEVVVKGASIENSAEQKANQLIQQALAESVEQYFLKNKIKGGDDS